MSEAPSVQSVHSKFATTGLSPTEISKSPSAMRKNEVQTSRVPKLSQKKFPIDPRSTREEAKVPTRSLFDPTTGTLKRKSYSDTYTGVSSGRNSPVFMVRRSLKPLRGACIESEMISPGIVPANVESLCIWCQDNNAHVVFEPCKHCIMCTSCVTKHDFYNEKQKGKKFCPTCRTPIIGTSSPLIAKLARPRVYSVYSFI